MMLLLGKAGNSYNEIRTWKTFQMALTFFLSTEYWNVGSKRCEIGIQLNYTHYTSQVRGRGKLSQIPGERASIKSWEEKAPFTKGDNI